MTPTLPDLIPFFDRYETVAREADALFSRIRAEFPAEVVCREKCSSCCHALFDLSLVEALYLNKRFQERFSGVERFQIMDRAGDVDRKTVKIKRKAFKDSSAGRDSNEILAEIAAVSIRCPLLGPDDLCLLYDVRPVTCRLYGVPTSIGGKAHTCGKTGFAAGEKYPTVALDKIQLRLAEISADLARATGTSYTELASMYVPVSSALVTTYDAAYLGIGGIRREKD